MKLACKSKRLIMKNIKTEILLIVGKLYLHNHQNKYVRDNQNLVDFTV